MGKTIKASYKIAKKMCKAHGVGIYARPLSKRKFNVELTDFPYDKDALRIGRDLPMAALVALLQIDEMGHGVSPPVYYMVQVIRNSRRTSTGLSI